MELFNTPRCAVRMYSRLGELLPRQGRKEHWQSLSKRTGFHLPHLVPRNGSTHNNEGQPVELAGCLLTVVGVMFAVMTASSVGQLLFWLLAALSFGFLWMKFLSYAFSANYPPADYETVRLMVRSIAAFRTQDD